MWSADTYVDKDSDVEIVFVRKPTAKQAALAKELLLPPTFFCYQNESGYISGDETDGEREVKGHFASLHKQKPRKKNVSPDSG